MDIIDALFGLPLHHNDPYTVDPMDPSQITHPLGDYLFALVADVLVPDVPGMGPLPVVPAADAVAVTTDPSDPPAAADKRHARSDFSHPTRDRANRGSLSPRCENLKSGQAVP